LSWSIVCDFIHDQYIFRKLGFEPIVLERALLEIQDSKGLSYNQVKNDGVLKFYV